METPLRPHVHLPYPELVEPEPASEPYRIRDSLAEPLPTSGMVDLTRRLMWVPFDVGARATTRHECGHVAWSPRRPARVRFDPRVLMSMEDARINLGLAGLGIPVDLDPEAHAHVVMLLAQDAKRGDGFALFARAIASLGTNVESALEAQLLATPGPYGPLVVAWMGRARVELEAARRVARGPVAPYARGVALARELARELRALGLLDARQQARTRFPAGCCVHVGEPGGGLLGKHGRRGRGDRVEDERGAVEPGRMHVRKAPLNVSLRPGRAGQAWRAATEGSVVRYLSRWPVDGAVFRRRARRGGGTVLVDTSGSMSLDVADLERLLMATPSGVRVAIYSGRGDEGELRIVADGGRRAVRAHLERFGNGNVVDLPALEWLASQSRPRIHCGDFQVTGCGDRGSAALRERCLAVCRRAGIRRVKTIDEAVAQLRGGGAASAAVGAR
ncbi:MAG: hypothetical protein ABFS41_08445 [Myxococcota bacterium]